MPKKRLLVCALIACLALTACGERTREGLTAMDLDEDASSAPAEATARRQGGKAASGSVAPGSEASAIPVSLPRIAYVYEYGFRVAAKAIPALQRRHADLCEKEGSQVCRIVEMSASGGEGDYVRASLTLDVAAPRARALGERLAQVAEAEGGSAISTSVTGEDLSKSIIDTEARLRARTLLRDRLMEILATRKGTVAELVEAERGVAQVNEEIDQARSWLAEMQGRVEFSRMTISYQSGAPGGGFLAPIRTVAGNLGTIVGTVIAALIALAAALGPLALAGWGLRRLWLRRRRDAAQTPAP